MVTRDPWDKPSKPEGLKVGDITKRSCNLTWSAPTSDGGDGIRSYIIEYRKSGLGSKWTRANDNLHVLEPTFKVTGLHDDVDYEFRVAAENRAGMGPYSETTVPIRPRIALGGELSHVMNDY